MQKKASQITVGDILEFTEEAKHAEDDITYCYEVTGVSEVVSGPLFNPQTVIGMTTVEVETGHDMGFEFHPDYVLVVQSNFR
jgi:hypothetical protein